MKRRLYRALAKGPALVLVLTLFVSLLGGAMPVRADTPPSAPGEAQTCPDHTAHDTACGYVAAMEGHACGHVHKVNDAEGGREDPLGGDGSCGYVAAKDAVLCTHAHNAECGYAETGAGAPCTLDCAAAEGLDGTHQPDCGYRPETPASSCTHAHDTVCSYVEEVAGAPCNHDHTSECGYVAAVAGAPCAHSCETCEPTLAKTITAFAALDFAVQYQDVESGAKLDALTLPDTLTATVDGAEGTIEGVTWACDAYDAEAGMTEDEYVFTAALPEGYRMAEGLAPPQIFALVDGGGTVGTLAVGAQFTVNSTEGVPLLYTVLTDDPDGSGAGRGTVSVGLADGTDPVGPLTVPAEVSDSGSTYEVTAVRDDAFSGRTGLTAATLPDSVTEVGYNAFDGCTALAAVTLPASLQEVNSWTFRGCASLQSITLPASVYWVGTSAFEGSGIQTISLPNGLEHIGAASFSESALTSVTIPAAVTALEALAFANCPNLTGITVAPGNSIVKSIDGVLFTNAASPDLLCYPGGRSDTAYSIPDGTQTIRSRAFAGNTALAKLVVPASVTTVGNYAFSGCASLAEISFLGAWPPNFDGTEAFSGCPFDRNGGAGGTIKVPASALTQYQSLLGGMVNGNTSIVAGSAASSFTVNSAEGVPLKFSVLTYDPDGDGPLKGTVSVGKGSPAPIGPVTVPATVENGGESYEVTEVAAEGFYYCNQMTAITLPGSVTAIRASAFSACSGLAAIALPNSVTDIDQSAFSSCSYLTSVTLPAGLSAIGAAAFQYCTRLAGITLPPTLTTIGASAFERTGLVSIDLPAGLAAIGNSAFSGTKLTGVSIPAGVSYLGTRVFSGCAELAAITVAAANPHYKSVDGVLFNNVGSLLMGYPTAAARTAYTIPGGVRWIDPSAFFGNAALTAVTLPADMADIGQTAFGNCASLSTLTFLGTTPPTFHDTDLLKTFKGTPFDPGVGPGGAITVPAGSLAAYQAALDGIVHTDTEITEGGSPTAPSPTADDLDYDLTAVTYNGTPRPVSVRARPGVTGLGAITVKYNGGPTAPTNAGSYTVTVDIAAGTGYAAVSGLSLGTYTINKRNPTAANLNYTLADLPYDGAPKPVTVMAKPGISGLGAITVKYNGSPMAPTAAGSYTVTADIAEGTNYTAATGLILGSFEITGQSMLPQIVTAASLTDLELPLGQHTLQTLRPLLPTQVRVTLSNGSKPYAQVVWSVDSSPPFNGDRAGEYVFTATPQASSAFGNDNGVTVTLKVRLVGAPPDAAIAVTAEGLSGLKVGQTVSGGKVVYTLSNSAYAPAGTLTLGDFTVANLPPGLSAGAASRVSDTVIEIPVTGTPTTAGSCTALTFAASIPAANVTGATADITPTGGYTPPSVAKGDGVAVSGPPSAAGVTHSSITANAVTIPGPNPGGQTVEYAISTGLVMPTTGWQDGLAFTGLEPGTSYYLFARAKATANYAAGPAQRSSPIATPTAPTAPRIDSSAAGTDTIDLTYGYATGHTKAYAVTGNPAPSQSASGIAGATFVDGTLTLPTGLAAGTHTVTLTATNTEGTATMTVTVIVGKAFLTVADLAFTIPTGLTYNGTSRPVSVTAKTGVTGIGTITVKYNGSTIAPTGAGSYTVSVDVTEGTNYRAATGLSLGSYTIGKAPLTITDATVAGKTYNGSTAATVAAVAFGGLQNNEGLTLGTDYTVSGAAFADANAGTGKAVSGTVALTSSARASNYSLASGALPATVTGDIDKAQATGVNQTQPVRAGVARECSFDLATLLPGGLSAADRAAVTYAVGAVADAEGLLATSPPIGPITGKTLTLDVAKVDSVGKMATVTISFTSGNYEIADAVITLTTVAKDPLNLSGVSTPGGTYNGSPFGYTGTPQLTNGSAPVSGIILEARYQSTDGGGYDSASAPASAGAYKLTLSVPGDNADYTGSWDFTFTIAQKQVTVRAEDKTATVGGALPTPTVRYTGFVGGDGSENALATKAVAAHAHAASTAAPGSFVIGFATEAVLNGTVGANYTLVHTNGTLTVQAAPAPPPTGQQAPPTPPATQPPAPGAPQATAPAQYPVTAPFATFTGSGSISATIGAPIGGFLRVLVDGEALDAEHYSVTASAGNTIVTLSEDYLKTLANGSYDVEIEFSGGSAVTSFKVDTEAEEDEAPATLPDAETPGSDYPAGSSGGATPPDENGSSSPIWLWLGGCVLAGLLALGGVYLRRRRRPRRK